MRRNLSRELRWTMSTLAPEAGAIPSAAPRKPDLNSVIAHTVYRIYNYDLHRRCVTALQIPEKRYLKKWYFKKIITALQIPENGSMSYRKS